MPSILIVCISGTGFLFPLSIIPGRVTLAVTQFLTLANLFIYQMVIFEVIFSISTNLPKENIINIARSLNLSIQHYFVFQSESPSSDRLNRLGVYLIVSLFFVISTIIELALVISLKRAGEWKLPKMINVVKIESNQKNLPEKSMTFLDKVDFWALALYCFFYILFNCVYWINNE